MAVGYGRGRGVPETLEDARERLAQLARLLVEGERVVADRHAEVEREGAIGRRAEVLDVGADVVEPPGVGLAEPATQRRVVEAVARHVGVFEDGLHVCFFEPLGVVLHARLRAPPGPLRRVVGRDAHAPALEVRAGVGLARERVGDRAEL